MAKIESKPDEIFESELAKDEIVLWSEDSFDRIEFDYLAFILPNLILIGAFYFLYQNATRGMTYEIFSMISVVTLCGVVCACLAVWISQRIKPGIKSTWAFTNFRKIGVMGEDRKVFIYTQLKDTKVIKILSKRKGSEIRFIDMDNKEIDITYSDRSPSSIEGILRKNFPNADVSIA